MSIDVNALKQGEVVGLALRRTQYVGVFDGMLNEYQIRLIRHDESLIYIDAPSVLEMVTDATWCYGHDFQTVFDEAVEMLREEDACGNDPASLVHFGGRQACLRMLEKNFGPLADGSRTWEIAVSEAVAKLTPA